MTTIGEVIQFLESIAPPSLQESYDNSGLICGDRSAVVTGVLVSLDALEEVIQEAIDTGANLIVSHHPIVFSGLKSLTGANYIERTVIKAIKHDIALYAIHTNLDNVLHSGVNEKLAAKLELSNLKILSETTSKSKFQIAVSELLKPDVIHLLEQKLAYEMDNFGVFIESGLDVTIHGPAFIASSIRKVCNRFGLSCAQSTYTSNMPQPIGSGLIGELSLPMPESEFLAHLKEKLELNVIRHTRLRAKSIQRVAVCGGSGSFLLPKAIKAKADIFITADYKYHQFFDADGQIVIADVGHYESEQFTLDLLVELISRKFSTFAARYTQVRTNPVYYFI